MANFPTVLDSFVNPDSAVNDLDSISVPHDTQHANANNAIVALEAKVGIDSSAVTSSIDYLLKNGSSIDPGHHHTNTTLDSIASSKVTGLPTFPTGTIVGTSDTQTLTNKTLTSPIISTISNTGTLTLPTSTDTLVGKATTDTLTNKTLTSPILQTSFVTKGVYDAGNTSTALTISAANGDRQKCTVNGSVTFTWSNFAAGSLVKLYINIDATGGYTITLPTGKWPGGTAGTFTTTASAKNTLIIDYDGTDYMYQLAAGFS